MSLILTPPSISINQNVPFPFGASGGVSPYAFTVKAGGAGGTINSSTGSYIAPPSFGVDTIIVTDSTTPTALTAQSTVNIVSPIQLLGDIITNQLGISSSRCWLWDQKQFDPTDNNLFIILSMLGCKPFGNKISYDGSGSGLTATQSTNFYGQVQIDLISRGLDALNLKEYVIMALRSDYAESQQELNSFKIATLPTSFVNLSNLDGSAILYRFTITIALQWMVNTTVAANYFNTFSSPSITTQP